MHGADEITIEIMPDGLVKITTDAISQANHSNAEQAIRFLTDLLGGEFAIARNKGRTHHHHHQSHIHLED